MQNHPAKTLFRLGRYETLHTVSRHKDKNPNHPRSKVRVQITTASDIIVPEGRKSTAIIVPHLKVWGNVEWTEL